MSDQAAQTTEPTDHLKAANEHLEMGTGLHEIGESDRADRWIAIAEVHANIALTEELRKVRQMLGRGTDDRYASVTIDGHVTTGAP